MGKEFIEYNSDRPIPCLVDSLCNCLTQYVRNYIAENRSIISNINKDVRDAVLVDTINYLGVLGGCGYGLYTKHLYDGSVDKEKVDAQYLLTILQNFYATYIFQNDMVASVLENNHMNNCTDKFDANDGALVLIDFINYIAQVNGYDRKFTLKELKEKIKIQDYKDEMKKLKSFLEKTSEYSEKLAQGESIDDIYSEMAKKNNLYEVSEDGVYKKICVINERVKIREMNSLEKEQVEEEIYAIAYAYGKMCKDIEGQPEIETIKKKLIDPSKREKIFHNKQWEERLVTVINN